MEDKDIITVFREKRMALKISQSRVAERMNTTASAVARLETGGGKKRHSPSTETLRRYALALGCEFCVTLKEREQV